MYYNKAIFYLSEERFMRVSQSKSKNSTSLYIIESVYTKDNKHTTRIVKKLGTVEELSKEHKDPLAWAKEVAKQMTEEAEQNKQRIKISYNPSKHIPQGEQALFNGGYLFLQQIYYRLGLDKITKTIHDRYKFEYDLNDILRLLVFGRILFPKSKKATFEDGQKLLEQPEFKPHDIYRALEVLAKESDTIQSALYQNSKKVMKRNTSILYYDCTNFFFELEEASGIRQYGVSKENRPNPIVQMGLFTDADGIPFAFAINPGNTSEQTTLKPLEQKIIRDFGKSKFVVCTDAGLSSMANRRFNTLQDRAFITIQSIKKMKAFQKQWALDPTGWHLEGSQAVYDLNEILEDPEAEDKYMDLVFYKERWFKEGDLEQRYIVSFSLKYKLYQASLRKEHVERAQKILDRGGYKRKGRNDPARFVSQLYFDADGAICDESLAYLNQERIQDEAMYDGFYCVATNLEDEASVILKANRRRWEIEESFRILKSEFKARPVYLSRDDRIEAHFLICFLSLYIFRILEKQLGERYSVEQIVHTLRHMDFLEARNDGYIPVYKRSELTDLLHEQAGFYTDFEILSVKDMRKVIKQSKQ